MQILHISDTHGAHDNLDLTGLHADVLIHSGDFTENGSQKETLQFFDWFGRQPFKHKILVPGNHDYFVEEMVNDEQLKKYFWPTTFHLLVSEGMEIDGVKFWGSPVTPWFFDMAFNQENDKIAGEWVRIPADTQVLITHGPRHGVLDKVRGQGLAGCFALRLVVEEQLPDLRLHLHGHIHNEHGQHRAGKVLTLNSAIMNEDYCPNNTVQFAVRQGDYFVSPDEQSLSHYLSGDAWDFAIEQDLVSKGILTLLSQIKKLGANFDVDVDGGLLFVYATFEHLEACEQALAKDELSSSLECEQFEQLFNGLVVVTHD